MLSDIRYTARSQSKVVSYANGVTSTFAYSDQRGWLNSLTHANGGSPLMALTYTRAATGRIDAVTSATDSTESRTYAYDDLDRLLSAANVGTPAYSQSFQYDVANNITFNSAVGAYTYPLAGSPHPHAPLTAGSKTLSYDANGNIVSDGTRSFLYDGDNRPTNVSGVLYSYAPDGERLSKLDAASGALTTYLGGDVELAGGVWTKYLTSDAKRVGSGPAAVTTWLHADHLASIRLITGASGQQLERANYRPYGQQFPGLSQSKGFINQKFDPETGLQYLHARYYDPVIGLFLTPDDWDPSRPGVGTNRYAYCFGDPINCRDPFGNMASSGSGTKAAVQGAQNMAQASSDRGMRGIPSSTSGSSSSGCCGSGSGNGGSGSGSGSNSDIHVLGTVINTSGGSCGNCVSASVPSNFIRVAGGSEEETANRSALQELLDPLEPQRAADEAFLLEQLRLLGEGDQLIPAETLSSADLARLQADVNAAQQRANNPGATTLIIDANRFPASAQHLEDAGATGVPLTVNRAVAAQNRAAALRGVPTVPGLDRDEAPPAVLRQPGDPVSVRTIPFGDNRGSGSSLGSQLRGVPDGSTVTIQIIR